VLDGFDSFVSDLRDSPQQAIEKHAAKAHAQLAEADIAKG
jgi:hypothetical protein